MKDEIASNIKRRRRRRKRPTKKYKRKKKEGKPMVYIQGGVKVTI